MFSLRVAHSMINDETASFNVPEHPMLEPKLGPPGAQTRCDAVLHEQVRAGTRLSTGGTLARLRVQSPLCVCVWRTSRARARCGRLVPLTDIEQFKPRRRLVTTVIVPLRKSVKGDPTGLHVTAAREVFENTSCAGR